MCFLSVGKSKILLRFVEVRDIVAVNSSKPTCSCVVHTFPPHVHLLSLEDFTLQCFGPQREGKMKRHQVGPEIQADVHSRYMDHSGRLVSWPHFCVSLLSFPMRPWAVGLFQSMPCHFCVVQAPSCLWVRKHEQIRRETNVTLHHDALPPTVSHVAPKCGASPLDKPHTPFSRLELQKQALGFSHQAPMLISKSFTDWFLSQKEQKVFPHLLYLCVYHCFYISFFHRNVVLCRLTVLGFFFVLNLPVELWIGFYKAIFLSILSAANFCCLKSVMRISQVWGYWCI